MIQEARDHANRLGLVPPFFDQTQYSMVHRDRSEVEYAPLYPDLGLTIWSPLGGGVLTGKYGADPEKWDAEWRAAGRLVNGRNGSAPPRGEELTEQQKALLEVRAIPHSPSLTPALLTCGVRRGRSGPASRRKCGR